MFPRSLADSGLEASWSAATLKLQACTTSIRPPHLHNSSTNMIALQVPEGYQKYIKKTDKEQTTWRTKRARASRRKRWTEELAGECEMSSKIQPCAPPIQAAPLRRNARPQILMTYSKADSLRDLGDEKGNEGDFVGRENFQNTRTCQKIFNEEKLDRAAEVTQLRVCNCLRSPREDGPHQLPRLARRDVDPQSKQCACRRTAEEQHENGPHPDEASDLNNQCENTEKQQEGKEKPQLPCESSCTGKQQLNNHSEREGEPMCGDDHETDDREVLDHEFGSHENSQYQNGEIEQAVEKRDLLRKKAERSLTIKDSGEEDLTCEGNHAMEGRVVNDHETGNHDVNLNHRSEIEQRMMESDQGEDETTIATNQYPWRAPRVMLQYLEQVMSTGGPTEWTVDNHDGAETWEEHQWQPKGKYRHDIEMSVNQYHRLTHALYQLEGATDQLVTTEKQSDNDERVMQEWQNIKEGVRLKCMEMFAEAEGQKKVDKVEIGKVEDQKRHQQTMDDDDQPHKQLAMFEKGSRVKRRRKILEDDSSDEEEPGRLVCNMNGDKWEALPYPIIIDSGACASVMPTGVVRPRAIERHTSIASGRVLPSRQWAENLQPWREGSLNDHQGRCDERYEIYSL